MHKAPLTYDFCSSQKYVSVDLPLYTFHTTDMLKATCYWCVYVLSQLIRNFNLNLPNCSSLQSSTCHSPLQFSAVLAELLIAGREK